MFTIKYKLVRKYMVTLRTETK